MHSGAVPLCSRRDKQKDEGPGRLIGVRPRALGAQRLWQACWPALYACLARRCPVPWGGGLGGAARADLSALQLPPLRGAGAHLRRCDHGNIYCAGECSRIRRRESLRRAGARYQRTPPRSTAAMPPASAAGAIGARQKVTHQGCRSGGIACSVSVHPTQRRGEHRCARTEPLVPHPAQHQSARTLRLLCAPLPPWTRHARWPWSG